MTTEKVLGNMNTKQQLKNHEHQETMARYQYKNNPIRNMNTKSNGKTKTQKKTRKKTQRRTQNNK